MAQSVGQKIQTRKEILFQFVITSQAGYAHKTVSNGWFDDRELRNNYSLTITPARKMPECLSLHVFLHVQSAEAEFNTFSGLGKSNRDRLSPR
jgi:hypothetical protein